MEHEEGRARKIVYRQGSKIFVTIIVVAVTVVVTSGLLLSGSPEKERSRQFDAVRVSNLQQITFALDTYFNFENRLPSGLEELLVRRDFSPSIMLDPKNGYPYEFKIIDMDTYELCAIFETESNTGINTKYPPTRPMPYPGFAAEDFWFHGSGHLCYTIDVRKDPVHFPAKL